MQQKDTRITVLPKWGSLRPRHRFKCVLHRQKRQSCYPSPGWNRSSKLIPNGTYEYDMERLKDQKNMHVHDTWNGTRWDLWSWWASLAFQERPHLWQWTHANPQTALQSNRIWKVRSVLYGYQGILLLFHRCWNEENGESCGEYWSLRHQGKSVAIDEE